MNRMNCMTKTLKVGGSKYWQPLISKYLEAPSIALCRVPELEYAASLALPRRCLDHCCGDGYFASLAWPGEKFSHGCDISPNAVEEARVQGRHEHLDVCDAGSRLPYDDSSFEVVFNNSALEHIADLDQALREIARVLAPGGTLAFNVLNHRYFKWWPMGDQAMHDYREWQPVYHALSRREWEMRLERVGLHIEEVHGYFGRPAARTLARLDCEFSGFLIRNRPSRLVAGYYKGGLRRWLWLQFIRRLSWKTAPDGGAGYYFIARK
jgi:SAM-dependent methyltransferase